MSASDEVCGRVDDEGRLVQADPRLAALHRSAGGEEGGVLAIPQIANLARLARRLAIVISRSAIAAEGERDLDLWVRAQPGTGGVELRITGWTDRAPRRPAPAGEADRQSDFLRASADWMWETDDTLRLTAISAAAAAAAGSTPVRLRGTPLNHLFTLRESEDGELPLLSALAERRRFDGQFAQLRSGRKTLYRLAGVPLIGGTGRFAGFRGSATSVHDSEASTFVLPVPAQVEQGAFGERLDEALRGPLAHIIANAEVIGAQLDGPLRSDYAGYATDIATAGRHLLALVDDLVDLQAIERPEYRPEAEDIDLVDVARRAAGLLSVRAAARNVRIDGPVGDEALPALGEFKRALQIITNLLTNAIRYSPEGGQVWIRTEREGDLALLVVADQGKGIAPEDQERIFDKFERVDASEAGGTGLGLYIARRLARAMGGDIAVDSQEGAGARFTLTLPLSSEA